MCIRDRTASLPIHSQDEIGVLKQQINDLYHHLLEVIDNLEQQKQENLKSVSYTHLDVYKRQTKSLFLHK